MKDAVLLDWTQICSGLESCIAQKSRFEMKLGFVYQVSCAVAWFGLSSGGFGQSVLLFRGFRGFRER